MGDNKLAALEARPWALPSGEPVSLLDDLQHLTVRVEAARLAAIREIDARGLYRDDAAPSTRVWLRNRYRMAITAASRLVRLAAAVDCAPPAVGEAVAAGKVNRSTWVAVSGWSRGSCGRRSSPATADAPFQDATAGRDGQRGIRSATGRPAGRRA